MRLRYVISLILFVFTTIANAFHLNPANRRPSMTVEDRHILDKISEPVHEALTRKTREAYWDRCRQVQNSPWCSEGKNESLTINDSLIRGVWWSDDPNQNLYKGRQVVWLGYMYDAEKRAKSGNYKIDDRYMMQYRSHYGDMQFLHSMATKDGEDATVTKQNILMWAEFLYQIATGKIGRETTFNQVSVIGLSNFFNRQSDWQLQWILQPRFRLSRPDDFSEHGLGILLHLIQDSFSAAHVDRDFASTEKCRSGQISQFFSYTNQNSKLHGMADTWSGYGLSKFPQGANPIDVGAEIIWFARRKADWEKEVRPYLDMTVFCLADDPKSAGPGKY